MLLENINKINKDLFNFFNFLIKDFISVKEFFKIKVLRNIFESSKFYDELTASLAEPGFPPCPKLDPPIPIGV